MLYDVAGFRPRLQMNHEAHVQRIVIALALLDFVSRAHEIKLCPSSVSQFSLKLRARISFKF